MSSPAASKQVPMSPVQADIVGDKSLRPAPSMSQLVRGLWGKPAPLPADAVLVHDPNAGRPHDLDDPFFDRGVQSRIAETIAQARRKK